MSDEPKESELVDDELEQATGGVGDTTRSDVAAASQGTPPIQITGQQTSTRVSKGPTDPDEVKS